MELQYLYGNPRRPHAKPSRKKISVRRSMKNPTIISSNPLSQAEVKKIRAQLAKQSKKPAKKLVRGSGAGDKAVKKLNKVSYEEKLKKVLAEIKANKKSPKKSVKKSSKHQGEGTMAKKARKVAKKAKKVAKRHVKKVHARKPAKKARKVAKKSVRKVAKKAVRKAVRKTAKRKVHARKASNPRGKKNKRAKVFKVVGGTVKRRGKKFRRNDKRKTVVAGKNTRISNIGRHLHKGEVMTEYVEFAPRRRKNKKTGKITEGKRKVIKVTEKAMNPRRKHKKHTKRRNPLVMSNPRFMKNPMGAMGSSIVNIENKMINNKIFKSVDNGFRSYLNAGVLEVTGLVVCSALDGFIVEGVDFIAGKVGAEKLLAKIPAQYKGAVLTGGTGIALHLLNSFLAKKSGKKSQVLDELSKGMIASALVKAVSYASPYSTKNHAGSNTATATAGFVMDRSMNGLIMSNPSSSMRTGNSDFSGADFEGADYGTSSISGADFEGYGGYVQSMGDVENAMDADDAMDDAMDEDEDYGSDVSSFSEKW